MFTYPVTIFGGSQLLEVFRVDAGDSNSYAGGTVVEDNDPVLNVTTDPADGSAQTAYQWLETGSNLEWTGTPNGKSSSEYFYCNTTGGLLKSTANTTFLNSLHKDNAKFTVMAAMVTGASTSGLGIFQTCNGGTGVRGIQIVGDGGNINLKVSKGSGGLALDTTSTTSFPSSSTVIVGVAVDEANGIVRFFVNGTTETQTGKSYTTPSASNATDVGEMINGANTGLISKFYQLGMYQKAFTAADFNVWYSTYIDRY